MDAVLGPDTILIEAAVESLDAALAAAQGGAGRIELCEDLAQGGTTPPVELIRTARARLPIPIFVLVRVRAGDFVYTRAEHRATLDQIRAAKDGGAQGIVAGALTRDGDIDENQTRELVAAADPLPLTFHRAIDASRDIAAALGRVIACGAQRVLTSGGAPTALAGVDTIKRLVQQSRGKIVILPGGKIDASNARRIVTQTGVREVHFSAVGGEKVRRVIESLAGAPR